MEIKEWAEIQEELLKAQLRIIRECLRRDGSVRKDAVSPGARSRSQISIVKDILAAARAPLHISEIIRLAGEQHGVVLDRESVVSALIKKLKKGAPFVRTGPNTFGLKDT